MANTFQYRQPRKVGGLIATGVTTIPVNCYSFSVQNDGEANATVEGLTVKPGKTFSFDAGGDNAYYPSNSIGIDATGTELIVIYNTSY